MASIIKKILLWAVVIAAVLALGVSSVPQISHAFDILDIMQGGSITFTPKPGGGLNVVEEFGGDSISIAAFNAIKTISGAINNDIGNVMDEIKADFTSIFGSESSMALEAVSQTVTTPEPKIDFNYEGYPGVFEPLTDAGLVEYDNLVGYADSADSLSRSLLDVGELLVGVSDATKSLFVNGVKVVHIEKLSNGFSVGFTEGVSGAEIDSAIKWINSSLSKFSYTPYKGPGSLLVTNEYAGFGNIYGANGSSVAFYLPHTGQIYTTLNVLNSGNGEAVIHEYTHYILDDFINYGPPDQVRVLNASLTVLGDKILNSMTLRNTLVNYTIRSTGALTGYNELGFLNLAIGLFGAGYNPRAVQNFIGEEAVADFVANRLVSDIGFRPTGDPVLDGLLKSLSDFLVNNVRMINVRMIREY